MTPAWWPSLEAAGLVTRTDHPTDGRQVLLAASDAGTALLREDRRRREAWLAQRLRELDADDREVLRRPPRSSTGWPARERHLPLAAGAQLPAVRRRPDRLASPAPGRSGSRRDWLVLELSNNSGVALGIATSLQFLPVLLFGLYGGVLADRYDKRQLLIGAQAAMGVLALILAVLDLSGTVQLWHVYALAFGARARLRRRHPGAAGVRLEMVGPDDLPNAVSLNSATFNSARIVGPAIAGIAIAAVGTGWVFPPTPCRTSPCSPACAPCAPASCYPSQRLARAKGQPREGLSYVRSRPELLVPMVLVFVVGTFGLNFQITLALVVKEVFELGAGAYGLLSAFFAAGSLIGALASARRTGPPRQRTAVRRRARLRAARGRGRAGADLRLSWRCCWCRPAWRC